MENHVSRDIEESRNYEKELTKTLEAGDTSYAAVDVPLEHIRQSCCNALLADYKAANAQNAETRLWDSHQKVNAHYRAALAQVKKSSEPRVVERRKLGAEYLKFIKSSQTFYRGFVGRLSAAYGDIAVLQRVAKRFDANAQTNAASTPAGHPGSAELEQCCHRTLIRLGDLSRYREMELKEKENDRDWAPAIGYYDLASTVCPGSGQPYNQRAIIAIAGRYLFRATYYAYRSVTAEDPHPQGDGNLLRIMNMVGKAWDGRELVSKPNATAGATLPAGLVASFLRLVEQYSRGYDSIAGPELEKEVIGQLKDHLEQFPAEPASVKLVLICIAAQQAAQTRLLNQPDSFKLKNIYVSFLQLNMRVFTVLLQAFSEGLPQVKVTTPAQAQQALIPLVCRTLPTIRLYTSWLSKSSALLDGDIILDDFKAEFWTSLAKALTAVTATFPTELLPNLDHLLEEDEDTIGFAPLYTAINANIWSADGQTRPRWHDTTDQARDTTKEMLFRVKGFLVTGLTLAVNTVRLRCLVHVEVEFQANALQDSPLKLNLETSTFASSYAATGQGKIQRPRVLARPQPQANGTPVGKADHAEPKDVPTTPAPAASAAPVKLALTNEDDDMEAERMVNSLVDLEEEENFGEVRQEPKTPAARNTMSTFGTASPFPIGSNTVADIMAKTFRKTSPGAGRSPAGSRGTSQLRSPALAPILPRQQSHGSERSNGSIDMQRIWETPQSGDPLGRTPSYSQAQRSPALAARTSPLLRHSRVNSNELPPSSIWSPNAGGTATNWAASPEAPQTMSRSSSSRGYSLGNGTNFGTASPANGLDYGQGFGNDTIGFGSTLLPSPTQSPWNTGTPKRLSTGGSPLVPSSAQLPPPPSYGVVQQPPRLRLDSYTDQAKTFRPSNLQQHTSGRQMT